MTPWNVHSFKGLDYEVSVWIRYLMQAVKCWCCGIDWRHWTIQHMDHVQRCPKSCEDSHQEKWTSKMTWKQINLKKEGSAFHYHTSAVGTVIVKTKILLCPSHLTLLLSLFCPKLVLPNLISAQCPHRVPTRWCSSGQVLKSSIPYPNTRNCATGAYLQSRVQWQNPLCPWSKLWTKWSMRNSHSIANNLSTWQLTVSPCSAMPTNNWISWGETSWNPRYYQSINSCAHDQHSYSSALNLSSALGAHRRVGNWQSVEVSVADVADTSLTTCPNNHTSYAGPYQGYQAYQGYQGFHPPAGKALHEAIFFRWVVSMYTGRQ